MFMIGAAQWEERGPRTFVAPEATLDSVAAGSAVTPYMRCLSMGLMVR